MSMLRNILFSSRIAKANMIEWCKCGCANCNLGPCGGVRTTGQCDGLRCDCESYPDENDDDDDDYYEE